ncbi:zinc-binding dehydrogenase [Halomonas sp. SCS19]|uniref:zinc-binding dehydrogenase n=1 Tax=Halomonas sp. SCS19 TaxID=2950870 RepID=UPI0032DE7D6D
MLLEARLRPLVSLRHFRQFRSDRVGPEGIHEYQVARRDLASEEVRVRVAAVGLNYRDRALQDGSYLPQMTRPFVPLSEGSGVVLETGRDVIDLEVGQPVLGHYTIDWISGAFKESYHASKLGGPGDGWLSEEVIVPRRALVAVPSGWRLEEAAALAISGVTAWKSLGDLDELKGRYLLLAGTGNVSLQALQMAAAAGARPIVVTSRPALASRLRDLGAVAVIGREGGAADVASQVMAITESVGVGRAIDVVGGQFLVDAILPSMATNGHIALVGFLESGRVEGDLVGPAIRKLLHLEGISVGSRDDLEAMLRYMDRHGLRPAIGRRLRADDLPEWLANGAVSSGLRSGTIGERRPSVGLSATDPQDNDLELGKTLVIMDQRLAERIAE